MHIHESIAWLPLIYDRMCILYGVLGTWLAVRSSTYSSCWPTATIIIWMSRVMSGIILLLSFLFRFSLRSLISGWQIVSHLQSNCGQRLMVWPLAWAKYHFSFGLLFFSHKKYYITRWQTAYTLDYSTLFWPYPDDFLQVNGVPSADRLGRSW